MKPALALGLLAQLLSTAYATVFVSDTRLVRKIKDYGHHSKPVLLEATLALGLNSIRTKVVLWLVLQNSTLEFDDLPAANCER